MQELSVLGSQILEKSLNGSPAQTSAIAHERHNQTLKIYTSRFMEPSHLSSIEQTHQDFEASITPTAVDCLDLPQSQRRKN